MLRRVSCCFGFCKEPVDVRGLIFFSLLAAVSDVMRVAQCVLLQKRVFSSYN
jgi:hypothetical protein